MRCLLRAAAVLVLSSVFGFAGPAQAAPCATYQDNDGDNYGNPNVPSANCPTAGWVTDNTDCDDTNSARFPGNTETPGNNVDNDCNGQEICFLDNDNDDARSNSTITSTANTNCADANEAISGAPVDCNDSNSSVYPGATELTGDEIDSNCDGQEACYVDSDNDNYRPGAGISTVTSANTSCHDPGEAVITDPTGDCNDGNFNIHPMAPENVADGLDSNCDGYELCFLDNDNDGYRPGPSATKPSPNLLCLGTGDAVASDPTTDCNDNDSTINPDATETAGDEVDSDCDGQELCFEDQDNDGHGAGVSFTTVSLNTTCTDSGEARDSDPSDDCNDNDEFVNPGAIDICDGIDNDCSFIADDGACSAGDGDAGSDAGTDSGADPGSGGDGDSTGGDGDSTGGDGDAGSDPTVDGATGGSDDGAEAGTSPTDPNDTADAAEGPAPGNTPDGSDGNPSSGGTHAGGGASLDAGDIDSPGADGGADEPNDGASCSCRVVGQPVSWAPSLAGLVLLALALVRRRVVVNLNRS